MILQIFASFVLASDDVPVPVLSGRSEEEVEVGSRSLSDEVEVV